jgi:hypothetical protein
MIDIAAKNGVIHVIKAWRCSSNAHDAARIADRWAHWRRMMVLTNTPMV